LDVASNCASFASMMASRSNTLHSLEGGSTVSNSSMRMPDRVSRQVLRSFMGHRDGGQAQYVRMPVAESPGEGPLTDTLAWASANLGEALTVSDIAHHARMSERTFARRFREVTGTTPLRWVLNQRVLAAQRRLESSEDPVERIAQDCGFGTGATLRLHFGREVGVSPMRYRATFKQDAARYSA
jgi:transcriptional regulator GlxA family with amidase domain